jgi:hypothetical protein
MRYGMGEKLLTYMKLMELMKLFGSAWLWLLSCMVRCIPMGMMII